MFRVLAISDSLKTNFGAEKEYRLILKGTKPGARSYQCKCAVSQAFKNKSIESMEEVGAAIKKIIHFKTIRGKFSSVHPDLAAEGITRVEVGEEGLHFIKENATNQVSFDMREAKHLKYSKAMYFQRRHARKLKCLIQ